jgi:hypothetical protein
VLSLVGGTVFLVGTGTAHAAGISSPGDGAVITTHSPTSVRANGGACGGTLKVTGPFKTTPPANTQSGSGTLAVTVDPTTAANGAYTATLTSVDKDALGRCPGSSTTSTRSFTLKVNPNAPTAVDANLTGDHQITVSWNPGDEFDVSGYTVYDASSGSALTSVPRSACTSSRCSLVVDYPANASGPQSFNATARRPNGSGGTGTVESNKSSTASASLPSPPTPDPTPPPGGGGTGGSGGGGGTGTGGTAGGGTGGTAGGTAGGGTGTTAGGTAGGGTGGTGTGGIGSVNGGGGGLTFSARSGSIVLPPAPPAAIAAPGNPSPVIGPLPEGSFDPNLPYGSQNGYEKVVKRNAAQEVFHSVGAAFHGPRLFRALAGALLLLIAAGQLRLWLNRVPE